MTKFLFRSLILIVSLISFTSAIAFEAFVVKKISIEGNQRLSQDAVLADLPISVGETVTPAKANAAIHDLFKTGFYQDVTIERDGNTLIVKLVERPSIGSLEITGLKNKDDVEKILKANNIAVGRVYDPNVITRAEKEILRDYLSKQRYGVKVDTKVTTEERNRVAVVVDVYEGTVATIKEIKFVGNKAFSSRTLRAQMFHKTKNLFSWFDKSDHYSKEKLGADLEMLRSFYMDHGYINFKIESTQVSLSVDKQYVYFTINVSEGEQFFIKKLTLDGDMVIPREKMQAVVDKKIKPGAVFSLKSVLEVKDTLETMLGDEGYSKAEIRIVDEIDPETRMVNLRLVIDAYKRITVRRITFEGNTLTQDTVLRRDVEQFEGSWISTSKIKESKDAIMRDGFATNVDIKTVPVVDKDDQVDLVYKIDEQRTAQVSAGVSYSAAEGLGGNIGADLKNFVGTGKDVNFVFNHTKAMQVYNLGYTDPYFTNSGIGMGFNVYNSRNRLSKTSDVFNYLTDVTGFNIGWSLRVLQYDYFKFGFGVDHVVLRMNYPVSPTEAQYFARAYNSGQPSNGNMSLGFNEYFGTLGWIHNSLDNFLFPTKGWSQSLTFKGNIPASQLKIYKVDFDLSWFKTIVDPYVINLRGILGYQNVYGNKPFPFFKHYYLGGAESVRGYEERSLGPLSSQGTPFGGNIMVEGRAQIIFPPPFMPDTKTMRMALFLDGGQVYDSHNTKTLIG
ncbi:MAG TPA: outer membrane protein assembly factor BamA, partial [Gammaproteobacteria bacterium]|nr:outer membrane protein assembly factor BamA [Gammaproteobacteria bacterium]